MVKVYTIGYGGRSPGEFIGSLKHNGVVAVVDIRLRPDRSSMGTYAKAKDPGKGIGGLLSRAGIRYFSVVELGNLFLDFNDWQVRYQRLMEKAGDLLVERLRHVRPAVLSDVCGEGP